jgi:hypothetical protein
MLLFVGSIAGALKDSEYSDELARAAFVAIRVEPTRFYSTEDARAWLTSGSLDADSIAPASRRQIHERFHRRPQTR